MSEKFNGFNPEKSGAEKETREEIKPESGSVFDKVRGAVNSVMAEQKLQPEGRASTVSIYGGRIKTEADGSVVYNMRGLVSGVDRIGDKVLRAADDHIIKEPFKMAMQKPKAFINAVFSTGKRSR